MLLPLSASVQGRVDSHGQAVSQPPRGLKLCVHVKII
jgi:hypothetical protein